MTREEAISWLVSLTEHEGEDIPIYDNDIEALNMAIDTMRKYQKIQKIVKAVDEREIGYASMMHYLHKVMEMEVKDERDMW